MVTRVSLAELDFPPEPTLSLSTGYSVLPLEATSGFMLGGFGVASQFGQGPPLPSSLCISQEEKLSSKESRMSSWSWRETAYLPHGVSGVGPGGGQRCDKVAGVILNKQRKGTSRSGGFVLSLEG